MFVDGEVVGLHHVEALEHFERVLVFVLVLVELSLDEEQLLVVGFLKQSLVEEGLEHVAAFAVDAALDAVGEHVVVGGIQHHGFAHGFHSAFILPRVQTCLAEEHVDLLALAVVVGRKVLVEIFDCAIKILVVVGR